MGLDELFKYIENEFTPHGHCYLWKPVLVWLMASSDLLIFLSYMAIPVILGIFYYRSNKKIPFDWVFIAFGLFIVLCGFTHLMEIWNIWNTSYWFAGYLKLVTAIVSVVTAILLIPTMPKVLSLPTPTELLKVNEDLNREMALRHKLENDLVDSAYKSGKTESMMGVIHNLGNSMTNLVVTSDQIEKDLGKTPFVREGEKIKDYLKNFDPKNEEENKKFLNFLVESTDQLMTRNKSLMEESKRLNLGMEKMARVIIKEKNELKKEFFISEINLEETIKEAFEEFSNVLERRNISLKIDIPKDNILIKIDKFRLSDILVNLIKNTIEAFEESKKPDEKIITLKVEKEEGLIKIIFSDNGPGIADNDIEKLFTFGHTTKKDGLGIGLHSCALMASEMNSKLMAMNNSNGELTFTLSIKI